VKQVINAQLRSHEVLSHGASNAGDLETVTYNDGTPTVSHTYDRRGRMITVQRTSGGTSSTSSFTYNDANQLLAESYSGGTLGGLTVTSGYDSLLRRNSLSLNTQPSTLNHSFGYDSQSGRLQTVSDGTHSATYSYLANSPLVGQIIYKQNSTARMTTTKQYDKLNRLLSISSALPAPGSLLPAFAYQYNSANQRYRVSLADGSYWFYEYDALGQLRSGKKFWSDNTPVAGQQFEYSHDDIGNRTQTKAGGDQSGTGLRSADYTANSLNQYTSRAVPGAFDVLGLANASASVTVNSSPADYRRGEFFDELVNASNTSNPVWQSVSVTTSGGGSESGNVFVPKTPENFLYDYDGNMTTDGRWSFTWDGENRLIRLVANTGVGPQQRIDFEYDWQGRRIGKKVWNNTGGTGDPAVNLKFLYDGWNLVAILNSNFSLLNSFMWGLDLSGSMHGAGGVGGLLAVNDAVNGVHFVAYDGNGNVAALVKAADGILSAQYEYGPFGEPVRVTWGTISTNNPIRWSSKYVDSESDFAYYGRRYYSPSIARWHNRDPISELGGKNLYGFINNNSVNFVDILGLNGCCYCGPDVSRALNEVLTDITKTFNSWSPKQKSDACLEIIGLGQRGKKGAAVAWEIDELGYSTPQFEAAAIYNNPLSRGNCERCKYTVSIDGKCYYAAQANYAMWGRMFKVCGSYFNLYGYTFYSENMAVTGVLKWKEEQYQQVPEDPEVQQAVDFSKHGYSGAPLVHNLKDCEVKSSNVFKGNFNWTWEPNKPRKRVDHKP